MTLFVDGGVVLGTHAKVGVLIEWKGEFERKEGRDP